MENSEAVVLWQYSYAKFDESLLRIIHIAVKHNLLTEK